MAKNILRFPNNFYWGSSTSAHQVEGNNHNDWTVWERKNAKKLAFDARFKWENWQQGRFPEMFRKENYLSGRACDHYNRFKEDFDIAKSLGQNAHRLSIEWSRIEPQKGKFNKKEIEHYRKVINALKRRGLKPFVTLWHWTNPFWIRNIGGWENKKTIEYYERYVANITNELGKGVKFWLTLNEPTVYLTKSYITGAWPPQKRSLFSFDKAYKNMAQGHVRAYKTIHKACPNAQISFSNNISFVEPKHKFCLADQAMAKIYRYFGGERMYKLTDGNYDFVALQYYFHDVLCIYKIFRYLASGNSHEGEENEIEDDLGWPIYPQGIYQVLKNLQKYDKPIYITENGLADKEDGVRAKFIKENLFWVHKAIKEGVDVRGYFYWSLLDNFEWDKGFWPRFGLVEADYKTMKRKIRPSAREYGKICKSNQLEFLI